VQHSQFIFYKSWSSWQRLGFYALSIILVTLCVAAFYYSVIRQCSPGFYNAVGLFSLGCWMLYAWPQVIKNFSTRTSKGISLSTVGLSIIMSIGDLIAAYALDWPWPSKIGALLAIVPKLILLWQCFYYNLSREVLNVA
ncbi:MAG TPA: PQ-loop repeat-containing protein, partial [Gammaproteobacteria bacterium]|nr:PQ-loop repeat-containing protein [Gammaproteobacteria bacterium]